jgi:hypothetical protein
MPGVFLDFPDDCPQSPVSLPALIQRHLAIEHRPEERVREAQRVTVALDDAVIDGLIDCEPCLLSTEGRTYHPLARVRGGGDQPAHIPCLGRQATQVVPNKITEAFRDGDGPAGSDVRWCPTSDRALSSA